MEQTNKIIFGMDVGTIHSVVSFLGPNDKVLQSAQNWPYQGAHENYVMSRMYYKKGKFQLYGAQPVPSGGSGYNLIKEFKRHVHRLSTNSISSLDRDPLPAGVSLDSVYQHWLRHIFEHAKSEYEKQYRPSSDAWRERELVFTIPNGWATTEETLLRGAILGAKCVEDGKKIHFVSESDAMLHFILARDSSELEDSQEFIVCDAGGSTIDVALYRVIMVDPLEISEKRNAPSISIEADLSLAYEQYLNSSSGVAAGETDSQDVGKGSQESYDNTSLNLQIAKIVEGVNTLRDGHDPKLLVLAGGFCRIGQVYDELCQRYESGGLKIIRPEPDKFNAVADGALLWARGNCVTSHATSYAYGYLVSVKYRDNLPGVEGRKKLRFRHGEYVSHGWNPIVQFGDVMKEGTTYHMSFCKFFPSRFVDLSKVEVEWYAAEKGSNQYWVLDPEGDFMPGFRAVSIIQADLSTLRGKLTLVRGRSITYRLDFKVEIYFGAHSLDATIIWQEGPPDQRITKRQSACFFPPKNSLEEWMHES